MDEKLYHYTTEDIVNKIATTQSLWFSNVAHHFEKRNLELLIEPYYYQAVNELKKEFSDSEFIMRLPDIYTEIYSKDMVIKDHLCLEAENCLVLDSSEKYLWTFPIPFDFNIYTFSLSKSRKNKYLKDHFSAGCNKLLEINMEEIVQSCTQTIKEQIQLYLNNQPRISQNTPITDIGDIRLRVNKIDSIQLGHDYYEIGDIIYDKVEKIKRIRNMINSYRLQILDKSSITNINKIINLLMYELYRLSMFFKEDGYSLEEESRIFLLIPSVFTPNLNPLKDDDDKAKYIAINISNLNAILEVPYGVVDSGKPKLK